MRQIADYGHNTAENILWHPEENALYWLDIPVGKLFRGYFSGNHFHSECILQMDEAIGGFVFCQSENDCKVRLLLFASQGRVYEYCEKPKLCAEIDLVPSRFNDVFALSERFVLCGTMPSEDEADSRLLLYDAKTRKAEVVLENLKLANGMGLSPDRKYLYFADTRNFAVYRFAVGTQIEWQSPHKLIDFVGRQGRPDGLCVDTEGRIWLAETGAGMISCFSPEGWELKTLAVGTPKVTSCCLGESTLFVSTQGGSQQREEKAGGIFAQDVDARGQDECLIGNYALA